MTWYRIVCTPSGADRTTDVVTAMFASGAEGVHEDRDTLVTHVAEERVASAMLLNLRAVDADVGFEVSELVDVDWSSAWRASVGAHRVGGLTIAPPWLADGMDPERAVIIDPAMAFGTGEHPTTRGAVRLLAPIVTVGDAVADLGAGSAVLAIAAVKLGAARAFAIECDADAIANAEENVARNGVADRIVVLEGDAATLLPLVAPVQLILANIISSVLIDLLPKLPPALADGGVVILSGILSEERDAMLEALHTGGWIVVSEDVEAGWWSVRVSR
jgi:ribosomal protein L11 methyltransferase